MAFRRSRHPIWFWMMILLVGAGANAATNSDAAVARGAYLVLAANCISCHTASDGAAYAGGRAFTTRDSFLGQIYSSNITPDRESGIGTWSEADFTKAMRLGIAPSGRHLFPAFPYTAFSKLTTRDISAIFAYLKTVPAVRKKQPDNSMWFRLRPMLAVWDWLFFTPGELKPIANQSPEWNRGAYLVEALGHCGACHRPRNVFLAEVEGAPLSGGVLIEESRGGKQHRWAAPNLTPAKTGLEAWSIDELSRYLKSGHSRRAGVYGPMNEVFANSLRFLTPEDIKAMAVYLKNTPAAAVSASTPSLGADEHTRAQALYDKYCEECHLSSGRGALRKGPALAGSPVIQGQDAASLINVILNGADPSSSVPLAFDVYDDMPAFGAKLKDSEIAALANFLRVSWGNEAGRVAEADVAEQR